jgi:hypothetical protein
MFPISSRSSPEEWPKLDLAKRHLTRLALSWTVPHSRQAEAEFADLLDDEGAFAGVLSYTRGKVRHYRIEAAQVGLAADDALMVTVQYVVDADALSPFPALLEEGAWLLAPLQEVEITPPVHCQAEFTFANSPALETAVPLPLPLPAPNRPAPFDEIRGVRGVKYAEGGDASTAYSFILDRRANDDITLSLDFTLEPRVPEQMPDAALKDAAFLARHLVVAKRK